MGADSMYREDPFPDRMRLRGNVILRTIDMEVKADELDATENGWATLRGNVQVKLSTPSNMPRP